MNRTGSLRWVSGLAVCLALAMAAQAQQQQLIHGNAGEVATASAWQSVAHMPYGLEGTLLQNQNTFVSLPLATTVSTSRSLTRVKVLFYAGPAVHVTKIELWDGGTEVKSKVGSWTGNLYLYMKLPPGYQVQHGLSISLDLVSGSSVSAADRRFVLNGGGAEYQLVLVTQ